LDQDLQSANELGTAKQTCDEELRPLQKRKSKNVSQACALSAPLAAEEPRLGRTSFSRFNISCSSRTASTSATGNMQWSLSLSELHSMPHLHLQFCTRAHGHPSDLGNINKQNDQNARLATVAATCRVYLKIKYWNMMDMKWI
jgi:hypothetical protein